MAKTAHSHAKLIFYRNKIEFAPVTFSREETLEAFTKPEPFNLFGKYQKDVSKRVIGEPDFNNKVYKQCKLTIYEVL